MSLILSRDWVCAKTVCLRAGEPRRKAMSVSIRLRPKECVALFTHARRQEFTGLVVVIAGLMWLDLGTQKGQGIGAQSSNTHAS
jgi:hypothetical protein